MARLGFSTGSSALECFGSAGLAAGNNGVLNLQGRNLADSEGRNHISLLKDEAPMRGRELRLVGTVKF